MPAILRFEQERFAFYAPHNRKQLLEQTGYVSKSWRYREVATLAMRARHLHMDIVLHDSAHSESSAASTADSKAAEQASGETNADDDEDFHIVLPDDKTRQRVRICAAHLQVVVNELVRRTREATGHACKVVFAPGVRHFAYDSPVVSCYREEEGGGLRRGGECKF